MKGKNRLEISYLKIAHEFIDENGHDPGVQLERPEEQLVNLSCTAMPSTSPRSPTVGNPRSFVRGELRHKLRSFAPVAGCRRCLVGKTAWYPNSTHQALQPHRHSARQKSWICRQQNPCNPASKNRQ